MSNRLFIIADSQPLTRVGFTTIIKNEFAGYDVRIASDKKQLAEALGSCGGDAVVVDYSLFDLRSLDEMIVLQLRYAASHWVIVGDELADGLINRMCLEPSFSMVLKGESEAEIANALHAAACGRQYLSKSIEGVLRQHRRDADVNESLTATEREVLRLIASGKSVKEIAAIRCSSEHTIVAHKKNIFRKLGVNNVYEATRYALRSGLVEMMEYYI
ncbi:MAG: response regulator transcription factor [Muribaculaceae bacterium]